MSLGSKRSPLVEALEHRGPHNHLCSIYDGFREQFDVAIPFIKAGLERGEKCLYVADSDSPYDIRETMQAEGIDVERATRSKALVLIDERQAYLKNGPFDPEWMLNFWRESSAAAIGEGFSAFRAAAETDWLRRSIQTAAQWIDYENKFNRAVSGPNCYVLCQYDRLLHSPEVILNVIRTHPTVVYRGTVCRNLYYVPPDDLLSPDQPAKEVARLLATIQDRERVENFLREERARLRESERRFRLLVEGVKDYALYFLDPEGRVTAWNAGAERMYGYRAEEILGQHCLRFFPPEDTARGEPKKILRAAIKMARLETEAWQVRKDGTRFWADVLITAQRNDEGHLVGFSKLARDLTERRQTEEALREARVELAHVTRITMMGELAASIAHEINQPLTVVVTNANACRRLLSSESPDLEEVRKAIADIAEAGTRAGKVISRIRMLLKRGALTKTEVRIADVIRESLAFARGELQKHRIGVEMEPEAELPLVLADRVELQQVILNLIMNGIEAIAPIAQGPRVLRIVAQADPSSDVLVLVRDSGVGLNRENVSNIFEPFYTTKPNGMGMGLKISRSIVEAHGGRLWATPNQDGPGTTFQFTLPGRS